MDDSQALKTSNIKVHSYQLDLQLRTQYHFVRMTHVLRANGYGGGERIVRLDNHVASLGSRLEFAIGEILPRSVSNR